MKSESGQDAGLCSLGLPAISGRFVDGAFLVVVAKVDYTQPHSSGKLLHFGLQTDSTETKISRVGFKDSGDISIH